MSGFWFEKHRFRQSNHVGRAAVKALAPQATGGTVAAES
jgi:hypothetical protein